MPWASVQRGNACWPKHLRVGPLKTGQRSLFPVLDNLVLAQAIHHNLLPERLTDEEALALLVTLSKFTLGDVAAAFKATLQHLQKSTDLHATLCTPDGRQRLLPLAQRLGSNASTLHMINRWISDDPGGGALATLLPFSILLSLSSLHGSAHAACSAPAARKRAREDEGTQPAEDAALKRAQGVYRCAKQLETRLMNGLRCGRDSLPRATLLPLSRAALQGVFEGGSLLQGCAKSVAEGAPARRAQRAHRFSGQRPPRGTRVGGDPSTAVGWL